MNPYMIVQTERSENTIELSCLSRADSTPIQDDFYINNGARVDNLSSNFMRIEGNEGNFKFTITEENLREFIHVAMGGTLFYQN